MIQWFLHNTQFKCYEGDLKDWNEVIIVLKEISYVLGTIRDLNKSWKWDFILCFMLILRTLPISLTVFEASYLENLIGTPFWLKLSLKAAYIFQFNLVFPS